MSNVLKNLAKAKDEIANTKMVKEGKNSFSNYKYFTPEQVSTLVQNACNNNGLITKFDLVRNELGVEGHLTVYDIDSDESLVFTAITEIPDIKATNGAQQIGGCMTYVERYLKQTAFGIVDNNLDFDTTENIKKNIKTGNKDSNSYEGMLEAISLCTSSTELAGLSVEIGKLRDKVSSEQYDNIKKAYNDKNSALKS